jgi:hypothetical protein
MNGGETGFGANVLKRNTPARARTLARETGARRAGDGWNAGRSKNIGSSQSHVEPCRKAVSRRGAKECGATSTIAGAR